MMLITRVAGCALALAFASPVALAQPAPVTDAPTYLAKAAAGDRFERESSQAILAHKPRADVATFAKQMVADHTQSTAKVKAAARADGLAVPPPQLEPMQADAIARIKAARGADAEKAYLDSQRMAHAEALALHRGYASGGDKPALRQAAGAIAPVVEHHAHMLEQMTGG